MPDHVPADRHRDTGHLLDRFLYAIFSHVPEAGLPRRNWRVGAVRLRHRNDGDRLTVPAPLPRPLDPFTYIGEPCREVLKRHNMRIYRRLHFTSSESRLAAVPGGATASPGHSSS